MKSKPRLTYKHTISQKEAARRCDVDERTIRRWRGRYLTPVPDPSDPSGRRKIYDSDEVSRVVTRRLGVRSSDQVPSPLASGVRDHRKLASNEEPLAIPQCASAPETSNARLIVTEHDLEMERWEQELLAQERRRRGLSESLDDEETGPPSKTAP